MKRDPKVILKFKIDAQPYELPITDSIGFGLTPREAGRIKRLASGEAGVSMLEAIGNGDSEVLAALAIVAAARAGVDVNEDSVMDGKCELEVDISEVSVPLEGVVGDVEDTTPTMPMIPAGTGLQS